MIRRGLFVFILAIIATSSVAARTLHRVSANETSDFQRDVELYPNALLAASKMTPAVGIDASPHVYTTILRAAAPGDQRRATEILQILRQALVRYKDSRSAVTDGFQPFMLKTAQPLYWFISDRNAYMSAYTFNPGHPTCLLYKKSNGAYELVGALFTAPKSATESQLNDRIPLSVARWHENVNLCVAPKLARGQTSDVKRFGMDGSIATQSACATAGGRWVPQVFGWMVAVLPFEKDPSAIWPR